MIDKKTREKKLFGLKLKLLRRKHEISQEACAVNSGCNLRTWTRWEKGESYPRPVYRPFILALFPEIKGL